ncbi:hypothetical protein AAFF_G00121480 [Aldrovandia affinis]|uniref:Uncharacterized protein n=1 Tax=Aldrovandia affinis TaxID=143900 RepID=A0AAD7RSF6_9TELE|nr:hypothetical protein AAFF_G00121480 [Aldrovandia affinis]
MTPWYPDVRLARLLLGPQDISSPLPLALAHGTQLHTSSTDCSVDTGAVSPWSPVRMQSDPDLQQLLVVQSQPGGAREMGEWSTGLCNCCEDKGECCFALWCLPVFACKTTRALGACPCLPLLDCVGCVPPASLAMRAAARERYGIKGNVWSDCFYGCCCYALSWCQISREIKRRAARTL